MNEALQIAASLVLLVGLVLTPRARTLSVPARVAVAVLFGALFVQQVLDVLERHRVAWADPVGDAIAGAVPFLWGGLLLLMVDRFHTRRLSAQRAQTDSLIDELPAAVAVLDAGARVVRTSAGWRQLFPSAPLDVPLSESVGPLPEALAAALRRTLADELRGAGDAERVPGEDRWWSWVVSSWQDADASGAIVMIQDVTSRVHRETDRESTQRLAIVGELAAGVAHDMNNLLTVLQLHVESMRRRSGSANEASLRSMEEAVQLASEMTHGVLRLAKPGEDEGRAQVALASLVGDTVRLVRSTLLRKYELVLTSTGRPATLDGSATRLQQMLLNLIVNARDAMPEGGRIDVSVVATEDEAQIRVSDRGPGIAPELLPRIFTPFFTTKGAAGTGLGLSVVRGVAEEHGGRIEVSSEPGEGTTFTITLPVGSHARVPQRRAS
ncbi:MAG: PAS domain-containing protein [Sandaracinus sp.]|nr:PAS domain-containing protein [Myxococcales bacterium]MCB9618566.1 PAS domain-containing protein [Sandaracinus sp.]